MSRVAVEGVDEVDEVDEVDSVERELLKTWPDRFRFPDVLVALVRRPAPGDAEDATVDGTTLARAVLARIGGRPPRAVCEELVERGEFDAAEYALTDCPDLGGHEAESLTRHLQKARAAAVETVRQRVTALQRRAAAAGVAVDPPDADALGELARSRTAAAEAVLDGAEEELGTRVAPLAQDLQERLDRKSAETPARGGRAVERVKALITAGELVAARALLNREPLGVPIPEGVTPLPWWNPEWSPQKYLEYHLNPALPRPPDFAAWEAADSSGIDLLKAYGQLDREDSAKAAQAFADALSRFLGAPRGGAMPHRVPDTPFQYTFFDGLFGVGPLSRLHPTGRVDLYIGGPGTTAVPDRFEGQAPHVVVAPGLEPPDYTDRRDTAVLSLRDLLRLVVLPDDRAAAVLGLVARQWPVTALIGDSAAALAAILGDEPDTAWRTLRWITHLSLGGGHAVVQAMENCTGMDPALLTVMLRYAAHRAVADAGTDLWAVSAGGWQRDEALVHALREDLVARCGDPVTEAAWWAALAACDPETGHVSREDVALLAELCSTWPPVKERVAAGVDVLVGRRLLVPGSDGVHGLAVAAGDGGAPGLATAAGDEAAQDPAVAAGKGDVRDGAVPAGPEGTDDPATPAANDAAPALKVPLNGVVRTLRAAAEQQLAVLLERLEHARDERNADPVATPDTPLAPTGWTPWHRNRFATVPAALARHTEAEARDADAAELAALAAEAERELWDHQPEARALAGTRPNTEVAPLLHSLAEQCEEQYAGVQLDVRCPPGLRVDVPEPVLRAVLYEVLDNAAEALASGDGGMVQVLTKAASPEVLVEVQDSGPGLPAEAEGRRIFLLGWTTRGEDRGAGLYRARRFLRAFATPSVEAELAAFDSAHPTLTGAALRLVLPEHAP